MGRAIGGIIQGAGNLKEAKAKRRDGKELIARAKQKQKNFERTDDTVNHLSFVKADDSGARLASDNIKISAADSVAAARGGGIRSMGLVSRIQQSTNDALAEQAARLSEKQSSIDFAAAKEEARMTDRAIAQDNLEQERIDSMLERGQALRSQGAAEAGRAALNLGGTLDGGIRDGASFFQAGGFRNFGRAFGTATTPDIPSTATQPYFGY